MFEVSKLTLEVDKNIYAWDFKWKLDILLKHEMIWFFHKMRALIIFQLSNFVLFTKHVLSMESYGNANQYANETYNYLYGKSIWDLQLLNEGSSMSYDYLETESVWQVSGISYGYLVMGCQYVMMV